MKTKTKRKKNSEVNQEFNKILCAARKSAGITQTQLSQKTGISQCDISRIETGQANPSMKTLKRVAAGLNMCIKLELVPA